MDADRHNRLHPEAPRKAGWAERCLGAVQGPVIAATDYMRAVPDMIRGWVPQRYITLGTDGFGRSDSRANLRDFFEVDRRHVAVAALHALAEDGVIDQSVVAEAIKRYDIKPNRPNPWDC